MLCYEESSSLNSSCQMDPGYVRARPLSVVNRGYNVDTGPSVMKCAPPDSSYVHYLTVAGLLAGGLLECMFVNQL